MFNNKKKLIEEVKEFVQSIQTEAFFLMQTDATRKLLGNTNAYRAREEIEKELKKMASKIAQEK